MRIGRLTFGVYTADSMYTGDNICVSRDYDKIVEHVDVAFNGTLDL